MKVLVLGGGVVGSAVAWRLAARGHQVTLFDAARPEVATAASAGMLGLRSELTRAGPALALARESARLWRRSLPGLGGEDLLLSGRAGTAWLIARGEVDAFLAARRFQVEAGFPEPRALPASARAGLPALAPGLVALGYPEEVALYPPALRRALQAAARREGACFSSERVEALRVIGARCRGVEVAGQARLADAVVLAAGCWSPSLPAERLALPVKAVRGQVALLPGTSSHVLRGEGFYLVPRPGGELLIGATEEPTQLETAGQGGEARALEGVLEAAARALPELSPRGPRWVLSGLRPCSPDGQPLVGRAPEAAGLAGLWLATGHTRNGVLLAALTAEVIVAGLEDRALEGGLDLSPWDPGRFG